MRSRGYFEIAQKSIHHGEVGHVRVTCASEMNEVVVLSILRMMLVLHPPSSNSSVVGARPLRSEFCLRLDLLK